MRWAVLLTLCAACGDDGPALDAAPTDAAIVDGAAIDAPIDAVPLDACTTRTLLAGGVDPVAQGWTVTQMAPATLTLPTATTTQLSTSTVGSTSGQLLLALPGAVTLPFTIEVTLRVDAVDPHNQFDAAVAIMGAFTPPASLPAERSEMISVDAAAIGWADDSASTAAAALDGAFHVYRLAVDAAGAATVSRDGTPLLTRAGFTTNGTIAIGDQTNDRNVDATMTLQSVTLLCP